MDYFITDYKTGATSDSDCVVLEDSIMQKGKLVTAGSKILENFISPFDATVVSRLIAKDKKILGKTKLNEFGIGRISQDRPDDVSGAVTAVADGIAEAGLCNDFSGTVRRQAAEHGLCYIHPTYGTVSRYGLIPAISSMDQIGVVCRDLAAGFDILSVIAGSDPNDGAMYPDKVYSYSSAAAASKNIKLGVPGNVMDLANEDGKSAVIEFAKQFDTAEECDLKYFDVYSQVMYILGCAEISNNINRYDGIKFGYRTNNYKTLNDLYLNTRTEAFGLDTKLAAVMGSMVLSQEQYAPYYEKAMKIRRLIKESLEFDKYDIIVLPSGMKGDPYKQNALYALATLAGLPSVSMPYHGGGIHLIANVKNENALYTAWEVTKQ